jgi:hypothetical protein
MKVKLKGKPVRISLNDCVDGEFLGIDLYTWKKINQGQTVDLIEIPEEAKDYLVSTEKKTKKKQEKKVKKGEK